MTSARPLPFNDDHGDQFPGALPAPAVPTPSRPAGAEQRLVRMHAAYVQKVNAAVQADREDLAHELATTFAEDHAVDHADLDALRQRQATPRRTPTRSHGSRPPGQPATRLGRMGRFTRRSLERLDRYTLDVLNPGRPGRPDTDR